MIRSMKSEEDLNYVIDVHWRIYTTEYNYDTSFIQFFTEAIRTYFNNSKPEEDNLWLLEIDEKPKGCIAIVRTEDDTAQLRWLLLEPEVRNRGYGNILMQHAMEFCREKGYQKIFLWTNNSLTTARALYSRYGFNIVKSRIRTLSNQELIEDRWELIF